MLIKSNKRAEWAVNSSALLVFMNGFSSLPALADGYPTPVVPSVVTTSSTKKTNTAMSIGLGQTQVIDVSNGSIHRLSGNLVNKGTLYLVSSNPQVDTATLVARNIFNYPGASISTVLPSSGISGFDSAISNLNLSLIAIRNIVNNGSISSAGNLNLVAGGTITNAPAAGAIASTAALTAANNLNLLSSSIVNHGLIVSQFGNVNVANSSLYTATMNQLALTGVSHNLSNIVKINNTAGVIQALNGVVNVGSANYGTKSVLTMLGGEVLSPELNLNAGAGNLKALLDDVSGTLNVNARIAHVGSSQPVLNLGNLKVDGDPTFFNNAGDITITGDISAGEDLAILASGNILSSGQFYITTIDGANQGHDIYMVAGAQLNPVGNPVATPNVNNSTVGITNTQAITVVGASASGGSISLGNTILDTRGAGDVSNGGGVTLVAYKGTSLPLGGGIENVYILSGGSGTGKNGKVDIIAGGSILLTNNAVQNVQINAGDGPSIKVAAPINIYANQPTGSATFNFQGKLTAGKGFGPGQTSGMDIQINKEVFTAGGDITIKSTGNVVVGANSVNPLFPQINSSGESGGRNAGGITIESKNLTVMGVIAANGDDGADGADGINGLPGKVGGVGGSGGLISLTGDTGINLLASVFANGGRGGAGGDGGDGVKTGQAGGGGGVGGPGGGAGSVSLTTTDTAIVLDAAASIIVNGGVGGKGGNGGFGAISSLLAPRGANGGAGGDAGIGGSGGGIKTISGNGAVTLNGILEGKGGSGADGGVGRDGVAGVSKGGNGGASGGGSNGGGGGMLTIINKAANILLTRLDLSGGAGGISAKSGSGATGAIGGDGGQVDTSGSGGSGGLVFINSDSGTIDFTTDINLAGGAGANVTSNAGNGANGTSMGGKGGFVLDAGNGGAGGSLTAKSAGAITVNAPIAAYGGIGGDFAATGGAGGDGATGNFGGSAGESGDGGKGGSVTLTSDGDITVNFKIDTSGNNAGTNTGFGGQGGTGTSKNGGAGGSVDNGGNGGKANDIKISSKGTVVITADLLARGGNGSLHFGEAGNGGDGVNRAGGAGGNVFDSGKGGDGGNITIEAGHDITVFKDNFTKLYVDSSGGTGGAMQAQGGEGGKGNFGGAGGSVGASGKGGAAASITMKTTQLQLLGPGLVTIDNTSVFANGGAAGLYEANAGNGGNALKGDGGKGGSLNSQGDGGAGGKIFFTGLDFNLTKTSFAYARGGSTPGFNLTLGSSGNGGNGGGTAADADGGSAGSVGNAGSGGRGGLVQIDMKNAIVIDNGSSKASDDSISTRGGSVGDNNARSGNGGDAGIGVSGDGGNGGQIGVNGSGGDGGDIIIIGDAGDVTAATPASPFAILASTGGKIGVVFSKSGKGGNASLNGNGGNGGAILDNGNGGNSGDIKISTGDGAIMLTPFIATGGDISGTWSPSTGDGGTGAGVGNGGKSGSIGNNGKGGKGGDISLSTKANALTVLNDPTRGFIGIAGNVAATWITYGGTVNFLNFSNPTTGNGGNAIGTGNGGDSGSIGNNGKGGDGGQVFLSTDAGTINTPKGGIGAGGADGGLFAAITGHGGSASGEDGGNGGASGSIGANSPGGAGGLVSIMSKTGEVIIEGFLNVPGGSANGNLSVTGNGGSSLGSDGGKSGAIFQGGDGGKGGKVLVGTAGDVTSGEFISVVGGSAAAQSYSPATGNGGEGAAAGGNSGEIFFVGSAGDGGYAEVKSGGTVNLDRILADGGFPGTIFGATSMQGKSGNGGKGVTKGGDAGRVGNAAKGGGGGEILVEAGVTIATSVQFGVRGGAGGDQRGVGGNGGEAMQTGGKGGSVGDAGDGGDAGKITLTAKVGPTLSIRSILAHGGSGGSNIGFGGDGGNSTIGFGNAGDGGSVGNAGNGGKGSPLVKANIVNLAADTNVLILDAADTLDFPYLLFGGAGGAQLGVSGNGGNGPTGAIRKNSVGGSGGQVGSSGNGGDGGVLKFDVPFGSLKLFDVWSFGGTAGEYKASTGNGGLGYGEGAVGKGGDGGQLLKQGDGGKGGEIIFSGANMTIMPKDTSGPTPGPVYILLNGGDALVMDVHSGNGGPGGGNAGVGGQIGAAGSGGDGGKLTVMADSTVTVTNGQVLLNGGNRLEVFATTGNGGDAGNGKLAGNGGDAGSILPAGKAGSGGTVSVSSKGGSFMGTGIIQANGGNASNVSYVSGSGGDAFILRLAGKGGSIAAGPGSGTGGILKVSTEGNIDFPVFEAKGGNIANYFAITGNGGNGGKSAGDGGAGGDIAGTGMAGDGGLIDLTTDSLLLPFSGDVKVTTLTVTGGSVGNFNATSGNGGDAQLTAINGAGGIGGPIKNSGAAGKGGGISITTKGSVQGMLASTDVWDASGGNYGTFTVSSGDGGKASPSQTKAGAAGGGDGGPLGNNGTAGGAGSIVLTGKGVAFVQLLGSLTANGGNVGAYEGHSGNGGTGFIGGDGGVVGNNGDAGSGGIINITTDKGLISTQAITASGGLTGDHNGISGKGGLGQQTGGGGGQVGTSGAGGGGGGIKLAVLGGGAAVTVNGDLTAVGTNGGTMNGMVQDAANGVNKGGQGGSVDVTGDGGGGGLVDISTKAGAISVTGTINVSQGNGGVQNGKAGKAGNATTTLLVLDKGVGGGGGSIGTTGSGGVVGVFPTKISVSSESNAVTITGDVWANGGNGGNNFGKATNGGTGTTLGGEGGSLGGTGNGGTAGTIDLKSKTTLTVGGTVSALGGNGGAQDKAVVGNGGNATSKTAGIGVGGQGGSVGVTGVGGNGGMITLKAPTQSVATPTVTLGKGGVQLPAAGTGGTGLKINGKNGFLFPAGVDGQNGTVTILSMAEFETDNADQHELKKRKSVPQLVAMDDGTVSVSDCIVCGHEQSESSELKEIGYAQVVPLVEQNAREVISQNIIPSSITDNVWSRQLADALARSGVQLSAGRNGEHFYMKKGRLLFAVTQETVVGTEHGTLKLAAGSLAVVDVDNESITVRNLHDKQQGDVAFSRDTQNIDLSIGSQLILSKSGKDLADFTRESGIATRAAHSSDLSGGYRSHLSEFSLVGALASDRILKALSQSSNKAERKQFAQMAKNACILGSLTIRKGPFKVE